MTSIMRTSELIGLARNSPAELGVAALESFTQRDSTALLVIAGIARTHFEDAVAVAANPARARADNFRWWEIAFGAEVAARFLLLPKEP